MNSNNFTNYYGYGRINLYKALSHYTFNNLDYSASYITQNTAEHPGVFDVALGPGETRTLWVKFKNTGNATWFRDGVNPVQLATSSPQDRTSSFVNSNIRINMQEMVVTPGNTATFSFTIKAPNSPGLYYEHFEPVIENVRWLGVDMHWKIYVAAPGASYETQNTAEHPGVFDVALGSGETRRLWVSMKNTGDATWFKNGNNPVHLGTSDPQDRSSIFFNNQNVRGTLVEDIVVPGSYGTFELNITAPTQTGIFYEHFRPVMEGVTWFGPDMHWKIYVAPPGASYVSQTPSDQELVLSPGEKTTLNLKLRNTGDATWFKNNLYPVHLGTSEPKDRNSIFFNNQNPRISLQEDYVIPGSEGNFQFEITAPTTPGTYYENFQPVMENVTWFGPTTYWKIRVE
jgi:uncharacterized membrane protein